MPLTVASPFLIKNASVGRIQLAQNTVHCCGLVRIVMKLHLPLHLQTISFSRTDPLKWSFGWLHKNHTYNTDIRPLWSVDISFAA